MWFLLFAFPLVLNLPRLWRWARLPLVVALALLAWGCKKFEPYDYMKYSFPKEDSATYKQVLFDSTYTIYLYWLLDKKAERFRIRVSQFPTKGNLRGDSALSLYGYVYTGGQSLVYRTNPLPLLPPLPKDSVRIYAPYDSFAIHIVSQLPNGLLDSSYAKYIFLRPKN